MTNFKRDLLGASGILILVCALALTGSYTSRSQAKQVDEVRVVNTTAEPVPMTAQGTTTIVGNVSVSNTPTVQVGNSSAMPVMVRDVDNPARQPFEDSAVLDVPNGQMFASTVLTTAPTGKRLVIEHLTAHGFLPAGQALRDLYVQTSVGSNAHFLTPTLTATLGQQQDWYTASQLIRLYINPGHQVVIALTRNGTAGAGSFDLSISGYLVDVP